MPKIFAINIWSLISSQTGKIAISLFSAFLLVPAVAAAACTDKGSTVVYVNGIFTTQRDAQKDVDKLKTEYRNRTADYSADFINGYNPSHLAGLGDIVQSAAQMMGASISNFDRDTILLQIHPQVTTRKLVLVGHSQGALYSNALYDYLLAHGEPKAAVAVYQVGSPASSVAGAGRYLNSSGDTVLGTLRGLGFKFLANNIDLVPPVGDAQGDYPGHSFSGAYLAGAPERIVGDIQGTLQNLKADAATDTGECFTAPDDGLGYQAAKAGFVVADTAAAGLRVGVGAVQVAAVAAGNALAAAVQGAYGIAGKLVSDIGITVGGVAGITHAAEPKSKPTNFDILKKLYGSSLTNEEYQGLVGELGSAVAVAPVLAGVPAPQTVPQKITYLSSSHHHSSGESQSQAIDTPVDLIDPATTTEDVEAPADPATTTEPVIEPATTTPPVSDPTPTEPISFTIASQEDQSHLCDDPDWGGWLNCYVDPDLGTFTTDLGSGLSGALDSFTIAKDPLSPFNTFHPYLITIECFADSAYATPCTGWVMPGVATNNRADAVVQKASESSDGKYWTAYFAYKEGRNSGIEYPKDASGSAPVVLNPAYYYRLTISDLGWSTGVYGSATEPYWLLTGIK